MTPWLCLEMLVEYGSCQHAALELVVGTGLEGLYRITNGKMAELQILTKMHNN